MQTIRIAKFTSLFVLLLFLFSAGTTKAGLKTWTNSGGNNLWANASNWSPAGTPTSTDTVFFNSTSNANCSVNATVNIAGLFMDSTYTGTITQGAVAVTIGVHGWYILGNASFVGSASNITINGPFIQNNGTITCSSGLITMQDSSVINGGTFNGSTGNIDINGKFTLTGGTFRASSNTTFLARELMITGGVFNPNTGTVEFNSSTARTHDLNGTLTLHRVNINNTGNIHLNIASDDTLVVESRLTLLNGTFQSGILAAKDTILINASWDDGNGTLIINGAGDQHMIFNADWQGGNFILNKPSSTDALRLIRGTGNIIIGNTSTSLTLQKGRLILPASDDVTLNHLHTVIESDASVIAGGALTIIGGNLNINGGVFTHTSGTVEFRSSTARTHQFTNTMVVNRLIINYNGVQFNLSAGDTLQANAQTYLNNGIFNSGILVAKDSIVLNNSWDDGNGTLVVNGNTTQHMLFNDVWNGCNLIVNKTASEGILHLVKGTSQITLGNTSTNLSVQRGILSVPGNDTTDLNFMTITIGAEGEFSASPALTRISSNIQNNNGKITHNNGTVIIDNAATRTYQSTQIDTFYNFILNSTSSSIIFSITNGDTLVVMNQLTFQNGRLDTGVILSLGNINFLNTADNGTSPVIASGSGNTTVNVSANMTTRNFIFNKTNPTDTVFLINTLGTRITSGANTTELRVVRGVLSFPESDTVDFNFGSIIIESAGTWIATSTLSQISSSVTVNGRFIHNNGNYLMDAGTSRTYDVPGSLSFFNFNMNQSATLTLGTGDTLQIDGSLTLTNGVINTGWLNAKGEVTVGTAFDRGNTGLIFSGTTNQNFSVNNSSNFDGDVVINKPNTSTVTLTAPFVMDASGQDLILTNGYVVTTSTNLLTIGNGRTATGGSEQSFVRGPLRKTGVDPFTFPVGKGTVYAPIGISGPSNAAHHFTAEYFNSNPDGSYSRSSKEVAIHTVSAFEFWMLDRTNGTSNVNVTLSWNSSRSGTISDTADLLVTRWNGSQWVSHGKGSFTGNATSGTVTTPFTVNSFSPFALGSSGGVNVLPVEYVHVNASATPNGNLLQWATATEINNDYFDVEHASNATDFTPIGQVKGKGNSLEVVHYTFLHTQPSNGTNYYRLKQVDFDGTVHYSSIVVVQNETAQLYNAFPNPVTEVVTVSFYGVVKHIRISNLLGQEFQAPYSIDGNRIRVDVSALKSGVYLLQPENGKPLRVAVQH